MARLWFWFRKGKDNECVLAGSDKAGNYHPKPYQLSGWARVGHACTQTHPLWGGSGILNPSAMALHTAGYWTNYQMPDDAHDSRFQLWAV